MKKWLIILSIVAVMSLLLFLMMVFWPSPIGTFVPPSGSHKAGDVWMANLGSKTTMKMVWCPPGKFLMGSPDSEPGHCSDETQHEVTLTKGFWIGKYEVTQGQWQAIMGSCPSFFPQEPKKVVRWKMWKWEIPVWRKDFFNRYRLLPVEWVSWDDCQAFCKKAGPQFRLPTEAEWEYACRAGSTGSFAGTGKLDDMGWYDKNSGNKTHRVGAKHPNAWGLYDMHGNVEEWCSDRYGDYSTKLVAESTDLTEEEERISRGGPWALSSRYCRAANRCRAEPDYKYKTVGFRIVFR